MAGGRFGGRGHTGQCWELYNGPRGAGVGAEPTRGSPGRRVLRRVNGLGGAIPAVGGSVQAPGVCSETMGMRREPASAHRTQPGGWGWEAPWGRTIRRRRERGGAGSSLGRRGQSGARARARSAPELRKGQDCWGHPPPGPRLWVRGQIRRPSRWAASEKRLAQPHLLPRPGTPPYPPHPSDSIFLSRSRSAGPGASALWLRNSFSSLGGPLVLMRGLGGT